MHEAIFLINIACMTSEGKPGWTFLTNHGHVLVYLYRYPNAKISQISSAIGITERSTLTIVRDLEDQGYVSKLKVGRRNTYQVNADLQFRHPAEAGHRIEELLQIFAAGAQVSTLR